MWRQKGQVNIKSGIFLLHYKNLPQAQEPSYNRLIQALGDEAKVKPPLEAADEDIKADAVVIFYLCLQCLREYLLLLI